MFSENAFSRSPAIVPGFLFLGTDSFWKQAHFGNRLDFPPEIKKLPLLQQSAEKPDDIVFFLVIFIST
ncbi:hypothetical protein CKQ54_10000 [Rahnella variigena]|uniref:Uncharacterized protein n=1 Tax=Rahnella variigena TaxID=574964 RepID=A0ABX9PVM7_9GAMM|nr:hypothetical protein D6D38_00870 [Rahnella variigena]RKF68673.1 hypothetical protein CKQ54_10000 [Rahnella variigena]